MSFAPTMRPARQKLAVWLLVSLGLLILIAANGHLVYVAMTSQPDCVDHVRQGEGDALHTEFTAARSSCAPMKSIAAEAKRGRP